MRIFKEFKIFFTAILILNAALIPNLKAHACHPGEVPPATQHRQKFPVQAAALGGIYTGTAVNYSLSNVIRDIPKLTKWGEISSFHESMVFPNKELQSFLISNNQANPLFSNAFLIASKDNSVEDSNERFVRFFKFNINKNNVPNEKTSNEKTYLIENQDIKNNSLHLHYIKIPEELVKTKHKLVAEISLIYNSNSNSKDTAENRKLDFNVFKKSRLRALEGMSGKNQGNATISKKENNVCVVTREFKINSPDKQYVLSVFAPKDKTKGQELKEKDKVPYSYGKYVALVTIKAVP